MIHRSRHNPLVGDGVRRLLLAATLACACGLQGCATSLETFELGAGVGVVSVFGLLGCALNCR